MAKQNDIQNREERKQEGLSVHQTPTVIHTLRKSYIQSGKITFIQRWGGVNALGSGESDLALRLGIIPSSNGKHTN